MLVQFRVQTVQTISIVQTRTIRLTSVFFALGIAGNGENFYKFQVLTSQATCFAEARRTSLVVRVTESIYKYITNFYFISEVACSEVVRVNRSINLTNFYFVSRVKLLCCKSTIVK